MVIQIQKNFVKLGKQAVTWMVTQVKYIVQFVEKQQNQEMLLQN